MTHTVEISDEAWELLMAHRHDCGTPGTHEQEMDELFSVADEVWNFFNEKHLALLKKIKRRVQRRMKT